MIKSVLESYVPARDALEEFQAQRKELLLRSGSNIPKLDGMPRSGQIGDPTARAAEQLERLDSKIERAAERERSIRNQIEEWADLLMFDLGGKRSVNLSRVITLRYLQNLKIDDVSYELFGDLDDFDLKEDTFERRTYRLISEAVTLLCRYENEKN